MTLANEKMLTELIENYKAPIESFMNHALLTDRAYGCPGINVHFPNQKNMIKVFYEWFEKILLANIFD